MNTRTDANDSGFESLDGLLDDGLRAAFRRPETGTGRDASVVATLEETLGVRRRVLLRDVQDDHTVVAVSAPPGETEPAVGAGRYQVMGEIARGGVGVVLRGRDPDLGRDVAIKVLRRDHEHRPGMVARFVGEAQIAAQLQHPGILPVYELGLEESSRPYFSMKLIKGRTLAALLAERRHPAEDRTRFLGIFEQVCQAIAYAHAKGVVHRDLKPSNVMVGTFGEVQVVDWGLAKVLATGGLADEPPYGQDARAVATVRSGGADVESIAGSVFGTPAYMSPEQARGEVDTLDERSDVFSLGAILCEILSGAPPFAGDRNVALKRATAGDLHGTLDDLTSRDADEELVRIVRRCLSPKPADRPRDAGRVAEAVSDYLASLADRARASEVAAARAEAVAHQERRSRRLTLALATVVLCAVLCLGGGAVWVQKSRRAQIARRAEVVNEAIDEATGLLGRAVAAQVGEREPWHLVNVAADRLDERLAEGVVDSATRQRAERFFAKLATARRDRRLIEQIEEVVILGATHDDKVSWRWMEESLRAAFADYGIDLDALSREQVAERIRRSDLAAHLTDGLELWIATCGYLMTFGVELYSEAELREWLEVLYEVDPDPFATKVRKMVYGPPPTTGAVRALMQSIEFEKERPRTLAWLASAAYRTGDMDLVREIFRRALLIYPGDFMLNYDYAYNMMAAGDYDKAIRAYDRCLAIRSHSGGVWRGLGVALRKAGQLKDSVDALQQSVAYQPDHAPTYIDLGLSLGAVGDRSGAVDAYQRALALRPDLQRAEKLLNEARATADDSTNQGD